MARSRLMVVVFATLALTTVAVSAHAEPTQAHLMFVANDFISPAGSASSIAPRHSLEWDARTGRWGLQLGVEQHFDRDMKLKDLEPGVYYRLTPRLHIGGGVSLAPDQVDNLRLTVPQMPAPRVRLETTLKF